MKDRANSAKAIWMRRRDAIEALEDDRLDLLPDEPTRALWNACPNPPPLDAAEANAMFRRALEKSGVKPRWWFMPRPVSLTFATCGGVFLAAFLAFGPSNGPAAWVPLLQSLSPNSTLGAPIARVSRPLQVAKSAETEPNRVGTTRTVQPEIAAVKPGAAPVRVVSTSPAPRLVRSARITSVARAVDPVALPAKTQLSRLALAVATPAPRPFLYVAVTKPEPIVTASITHEDSNRGGYAKVTALRPNDNGVLVRTEATVTETEPDPQVVTHVPSWAMGTNGLPSPMSTRAAITAPTVDGGKE